MATAQSDDELISLARQKVGAHKTTQHPRSELKAELDAVKEQVAREIQSALNSGTIDIYEGEAVLDMATHLFFLRVADRRRRKESRARGASGGVVPSQEVPKGIGRLRRHSFEDATLGHWRDEVVRGFNRISGN